MNAAATLLTDDDRSALTARFDERVRFDAPLAPATWWNIGGPADATVAARTTAEAAFVLQWCFKRKVPCFVLGAGSNLLVGDGGMRGVVLQLGGIYDALDVRLEDGMVVARAGAGAMLPQLVAQAASLGADGVDGLAGIPATVGGALRMNAGTDREIGEFVREVRVQSPAHPQPAPVWVGFSYRSTTLPREAVVADVTLAFPCGDPAAVRARTQDRLVRRKATQPVAVPNAGSCFRNPPGDRAGRLIEAAGAKGWRAGGAEVSTLHANFIVNVGGAKALDVSSLLARVHRAVDETFGIDLHLEVHLVGEFVADA
ncbi:MAG TPA: UDP-N-acetylmuramate dehydrogenase [Candidatus Lustribacter sp.]|jgi:UDP-N-acetylmuramate dehydrogenase|nr:UDP-N-acetylmuramate dehydrogenase [Candidatus Lustribacter sp.]